MAVNGYSSKVSVAPQNSCLGCIACIFLILVLIFGIQIGSNQVEIDFFPPAIKWEKVDDQPEPSASEESLTESEESSSE